MTAQKASKVPPIRFKRFEKELEKKTLGSICTIGDVDHWMPETTSYGIPYVMTGDFCGINEIDFENAKLISEADFEKLTKKIKPEFGDILFARYASVGAVRHVRTNRKFIVSYSCAILKSNNSFNSEYLFFLLQSDKIQNRLKESINTGSQGNIGTESLRQLVCCFPQTAEQTQIGNYFKELDQLIGLHQRKHDKLVTLKKAMLQQMFPQAGASTPEIRFKGFEGDWEEKRLGDLGDTFSGLSGKTKEDFGHGAGRFVTYMNVFSNALSDERMTEPVEIDVAQYQVKYGDVFFTTSSETPEEVGMSSVWTTHSENVYLNSFCFGFRPTVKIDLFFLAYILRSGEFRKRISFLAQGISRYNISKRKTMELGLGLPNLSEQQKIGNYFRTLDELISKHATQQDKLKQVKSACLEKMFV